MLRAAALVVLLATCPMPAISQTGAQKVMVLIPGAGGASPQDFLMMSLDIFRSAGFSVEVTTSASQAASLVARSKASGARVTLVGMSLGAVTAAQALAGGARPDGVVFAAGGLLPPGTPNGSVIETLQTPAVLPRTLVLHHRRDGCRMTPPEGVAPFVRWSAGRARVAWIDGGGGDGFPCRPNTPHTFTGRTQAAATAIVSFANGGK